MATTKTRDGATEETAQRIRELNERIIDAGRRAGQSYLDVYEQTLTAIADVHERAGQSSRVDWLENLTRLQAGFARDATHAYAETARRLLT